MMPRRRRIAIAKPAPARGSLRPTEAAGIHPSLMKTPNREAGNVQRREARVPRWCSCEGVCASTHTTAMTTATRLRRKLLSTATTVGGIFWIHSSRRRRRREARLHRSFTEVLLQVLSAGDAATARHSRRVAELTDVLADESRLGRAERRTLRIAALLHDMGKVDEDFFDIVHGRAALDPEERARIEHHPHRSAHLLAPLDWAHPGLTRIVASHHERWDGKGYPEGLQGGKIPRAARMIALADTFDAMTQRRNYRQGGAVEEAIREICSGAGRQFDPALVELLRSRGVVRQWIAIARQGRVEEREAEAQTGEDGGVR